jgi:phage baseplate assembly protein W
MSSVHFGFPYRIGTDGRTAGATADDHVRHLIEQVLFTAQGERVNRPDFGAGARQMVFAENSPEVATAMQHLVQSSLQRWMGELIEVKAVDVRAAESSLVVAVRFRALDTAEERVVRLVREA